MTDLISQLGTGAVRDKIDDRDFKMEEIMGAPQVDWSKEIWLPRPPQQNQGSSDSCVSHAWSYYKWQLHGKNYSRRDLFGRIALDYGASIRDGGWQTVNNGQATQDEVPDPSPQTPANMRDKAGTQQAFRDDDKENSYFVIADRSIDGVGAAVEQYKGVVFGVDLSNIGWRDPTNPRPPLAGESTLGHALYAFNRHVHDGQKCIPCMPSWPNAQLHHIKENYFLTGNTFNAWTLIPKGETMTNSLIVKKGQEYGVYDPATSGEGLITLLRNRGITPPLKPDGTLDFTELDKMVGGSII